MASPCFPLLCYMRTPTSNEEANNADVALSMHLALRSPVSGDWEPLNGNYGIFFVSGTPSREAVNADAARACTASHDAVSQVRAAGCEGDLPSRGGPSGALPYAAVMPDVDIALASLRDPYLFRLADGRFGIVATRTSRGGAPDGSERDAMLFATSNDLLSFERFGLLRLAVDGGVRNPSVVFDPTVARYVVRWCDDAGSPRHAFCADIEGAARAHAVLGPAGEGVGPGPAPTFVDAATTGIPQARGGNVVSVSAEEAARLMDRFGRIVNVGADPIIVSVPASAGGEVAGLERTSVTLRYSDGSTATRRVDWDTAVLGDMRRALDDGTLGPGAHVEVHGSVRVPRYPVPFAVERADPSVFAWSFNGEPMFMFIATEDADGNCIDPRGGATHMPLRVAGSIAELADAAGGRAREIDLLARGDLNSEGRAMTGCFWAPELHVIDGRLSILFMPCFDGVEGDRRGLADMWTGRCHIMQLRKGPDGRDLDPRVKDNWSVPEPILGPDGGILNPVQLISLDMTVLEDSGRWYYLWQQVGSAWIAPFDPQRPARLTGRPVQLIVPEFAWDNLIAEGPNAIVHDGVIYLIYSGSSVGIDYATGLATAPAGVGADLLNPAVWTKLDYPLQKSGVYNGAWQLGTGHGMWSHDEDGNLIYVFHAAEYEDGAYGGRDAQVGRVHWAADGMPVLDMQADEELDPVYREVTMTVVVD